MGKQGILLVVSGPSGAGKSTLARALKERVRGLFFSVSATTRPPRDGEEHGREYSFLTEDRFHEMIDREEFLEHARVHGHLYGTPREPVERALERGEDALCDIDVQGAEQLKEKMPHAVLVFVLPPSREELETRLRGRRTESEEALRRRLDAAGKELKAAEGCGFSYLVVNDSVDKAVGELEGIILAEKCRFSSNAQEPPWTSWTSTS